MRADLPQWREKTDGSWDCGDPAEDFFRFRAWVEFGFDVVDYDKWMSALPPSAARDELVRIRNAAKGAMQADKMKPHLHLIWLSRKTMDGRPRKKPGDVGAATRYFRSERRRNETPRQLWDRLQTKCSSPYGEAPIFFEDDVMKQKQNEKPITFHSFLKRLKSDKRK